MYKPSLTTISGILSTVAGFLGIVFFFINPTVTIFCALISLLNSIIQVVSGDQNNLTTEIFTIIIAFIVALIINKSILNVVSFALCLVDVAILILGWISVLMFYKKRF